MGGLQGSHCIGPRVLAEPAWDLQHSKSVASPVETYGYTTLSASKTSICPAFNLGDCSEQEVKTKGDLTRSAWEHLAISGGNFGCHSWRMLRVSREERLGVLRNTCKAQESPTRRSHLLVVPSVRSSVLD